MKLQMQMLHIDLDRIIKLAVIVAILIFGFSLVYFYIIRPSVNKARLEKCLQAVKAEKTLHGETLYREAECYSKYPQR